MPEQHVLNLDIPQAQTVENFVVGDNRELLSTINGLGAGELGVWVHGPGSSGKSHLLRAGCMVAQNYGLRAAYVGAGQYARGSLRLTEALRYVAENGRVVAIDDVGYLIGHAEQEEELFNTYLRLHQEGGLLLVSHSQPASQVSFTTLDLASRMCSLQHFQIKPLNDEQKGELLRSRAHARGYALSKPVLDYWLARGPRDLGALLTDLTRLDQASLARQQKVTIPLLKQVLGY
jgi:DnaA family protein